MFCLFQFRSNSTCLLRLIRSVLLGLIGVFYCAAQVVKATDYTWVSNSDGFWASNGNWSPLAAPNSADAQVFIDDGDSSVTVTIDSNITIGGLVLGSNDTLAIHSQFDPVSLTSAGGFTNGGTIRLLGNSTSTERLSISSGTLTNSAAGVLHFVDGPGNPYFDGDLVNNGTVTVAHDTVFDKSMGSYTNNAQLSVAANRTLYVSNSGAFHQNGGELNLNGVLNIAGGSYTQNGGALNASGALVEGGAFDYLGGTITGTLSLKNTTLTLGPGSGGASLLMAHNNILASDVRAGQTITVQSGENAVTLTSDNSFTNHGTIRLQGNSVQVQRLTVTTGTLTNSATGLIDFPASAGVHRLNGDVVNNGTITMDQETTFDKSMGSFTNNNQLTVASNVAFTVGNAGTMYQNGGNFDLDGTLIASGGTYTQNGGLLDLSANALIDGGNVNYLGGTINGTLRLKNTTLTLGAGTNPVSVLMKDNNILASDVRAGHTVTVQSGENAVTVTSDNSFTNQGTIRLQGTSVQVQRLTVTSGTLTNSATGLVHFQASAGLHRFQGDLINNGTITVDQDTLFDKFMGSLTNNGVINVATSTIFEIGNLGTLNNLVGSTLTGGKYDIAGAFQFADANITSLQAEVILHGTAGIYNSSNSSNALTGLETIGTQGKLRLRDGASFSAINNVVGNAGVLELDGGTFDVDAVNNAATGTILGTGTINATVTNAGIVSPGSSPGILEIEGDYSQTSTGVLAIEIAGNDNSNPMNLEFDVLQVGTANLGGLLEIALTSGFTPAAADVFTVLDSVPNGISGAFSNVANNQRLATSGGEGSFLVTYNIAAGNVILSGFVLAGDFDVDGDVDGADFIAWQTNYPATTGATLADGDADVDGDVDGADFAAWQSNFPSAPGQGTSPVPEPSTLLLAAVSALGFLASRRRK